MSNLIAYQGGWLIPHDWKHAGAGVCIPGSINNFQGAAALVITPNSLAVCAKHGIVAAISLRSIKDVNVKRFDGVIMEQETSVGTVLAPPAGGGYGIEVLYSLDLYLQGKWKFMVFHANRAHEWESIIREAAFNAQLPGNLDDDTNIQSRDDVE